MDCRLAPLAIKQKFDLIQMPTGLWNTPQKNTRQVPEEENLLLKPHLDKLDSDRRVPLAEKGPWINSRSRLFSDMTFAKTNQTGVIFAGRGFQIAMASASRTLGRELATGCGAARWRH